MAEVEILVLPERKPVGRVRNIGNSMTVAEIKQEIYKFYKKVSPERMALKASSNKRTLKDEETWQSLNAGSGSVLFLKDMGPQIGWSTVFLAEYAGPLGVYLLFYMRPWLFYGSGASDLPMHFVVHVAAGCYIFHYVKRILETLFVHRFSHATMPLFNLFKNCFYYWMFTAYVAYHVNHPLYMAPSTIQIYGGLIAFWFCELGNLSIHLALRNLRPPGTKVRKIPFPTSNPFTALFNFVSCPNYTYEFGSWMSFTIMTQCLPAGLFAFAGLYQMTVWALDKHKKYKQEFNTYPRSRKAILPFLI